MDPLTLALLGTTVIAGGTSAYGAYQAGRGQRSADATSIYGANLGYAAQRETNLANVLLSQEGMRFSERMSSTAFQRSKADMLAAGYNPAVLMQGKGGAASAPPGITPQMKSPGDIVATTAVERARMKRENANLQSQTAANIAGAMVRLQEAKLTSTRQKIADAELVSANAKANAIKKNPEAYGTGAAIKERAGSVPAMTAMAAKVAVQNAKKSSHVVQRGYSRALSWTHKKYLQVRDKWKKSAIRRAWKKSGERR